MSQATFWVPSTVRRRTQTMAARGVCGLAAARLAAALAPGAVLFGGHEPNGQRRRRPLRRCSGGRQRRRRRARHHNGRPSHICPLKVVCLPPIRNISTFRFVAIGGHKEGKEPKQHSKVNLLSCLSYCSNELNYFIKIQSQKRQSRQKICHPKTMPPAR